MRKKILVRGPALTRSGYGEQSRFALRSLRTREDLFDIYLEPLSWGHTSWIVDDFEERKWFDHLIEKTVHYAHSGGTFDMSLQITIPNEWDRYAPVNIGYTAGIETTKVAPQWIEKAQLMDKIIVVSNHSKNIYNSTFYQAQLPDSEEKVFMKNETEIEVVNYPVRAFEPADIDIDFEYDFNFFASAQWGPRKNIGNTIQWFIEEFHDDEVGLLLKTNLAKNCLMDRELCETKIKDHISAYPDRKCKIYFLHGHMSEEEISAIYNHPKVKAFVTLTHGEGFGLPIFEAAYYGVPVVAPDWSGQCDFLYAPSKKNKNKMRPHFAKIDYSLELVPQDVVWEGVIQADSAWCIPHENSFKSRIREVYKNYDRFNSQAKNLKNYLVETFTEEGKYDEFATAVYGDDIPEPDIQSWLDNMSDMIEKHE